MVDTATSVTGIDEAGIDRQVRLRGSAIIAAVKAAGVGIVVSVPDITTSEGLLRPLASDTSMQLVRICKEDEGVAICLGLAYCGKRALLLIQNTGFLDSINALRGIAVEYGEEKIAEWLIDHRADVNARAELDVDGYGGHTPLFHTTVTFSIQADDSLARLLIRNGADPNLRATFRWPCFTRMGDGSPREYHDVTAMGFATAFQDPHCVNEAAIHVLREHGGN